MNKNNLTTKRLFHIQFDNSNIIIVCIFNWKTKYIGIRTEKTIKQFKHSKKEIKHTKKHHSICKMLQDHKTDLHNDPERLSTNFIQELININDNKIEVIT